MKTFVASYVEWPILLILPFTRASIRSSTSIALTAAELNLAVVAVAVVTVVVAVAAVVTADAVVAAEVEVASRATVGARVSCSLRSWRE